MHPWYMVLQLRNIPSILLETQLIQIVVYNLVTALQPTKLRTWRLSSAYITQDILAAIE